MFSYCKRAGLDNTKAYDYYMSNSPSKNSSPMLCSSLNPSFVQNRGIPIDLISVDSKLRGQDSSEQPFCSNYDEAEGLQFTTFRDQYLTQRAPIPTAPCASIEPKNFSNDSGNNMSELWYCNNVAKPMAGQLRITPPGGCKF